VYCIIKGISPNYLEKIENVVCRCQVVAFGDETSIFSNPLNSFTSDLCCILLMASRDERRARRRTLTEEENKAVQDLIKSTTPTSADEDYEERKRQR
jgi:hypothetical protein